MTKPSAPASGHAQEDMAFSDLPERAGQCAVGGGYIDDGEVVDWFGTRYICRAPNLVPLDDDA